MMDTSSHRVARAARARGRATAHLLSFALLAGPTAAGELALLSPSTGAEVATYTLDGQGDELGSSMTADLLTRSGERDYLVGAPGARPAGDGRPAFGSAVGFDIDDAAVLERWDGDALPGGPVRRLGHAVAVIGHPDGEPLAHFAIGAPATQGDPAEPAVVVVSAGKERYRITGKPGSLFGWRLQSVFEDVDGDGRGRLEFMVSAPAETRGRRLRAGSLSVHNPLTGRRVWKTRGKPAEGWFGASISTLGDLDGDGLDDLAVGAPGPGKRGDLPGSVFFLSSADGELLREVEGEEEGSRFGWALQRVHDHDGDGFVDLLVSAPRATVGRRVDAGLVVLLSGRDGSELVRIEGRKRRQRFGVALTGLPEGRGWLIASLYARKRPGPKDERGGIDLIDLETLAAKRRWRGRGQNERLGGTLSVAADLDGDGQREVIAVRPQVPFAEFDE